MSRISILTRFAAILTMLAIAAGLALAPASARQPVAVEPSGRTAVDLAAVPVWPDALPESGFQMVQGGRLDYPQLVLALTGDELSPGSPLAASEDDFTGAYAMVLGLHDDRADPYSDLLAQVTTYVIGYDSSSSADLAADDVVTSLELDVGESFGDVNVHTWTGGLTGVAQESGYVVVVDYAFDQQRFATRQNTEDWTAESVAEVTSVTVDRLERVLNGDSDPGFGAATLIVSGPDAVSGMPWAYYPTTDHYRVWDGELLPYGGELRSDVRRATPAGATDVFVSRQQFGANDYDHMIDVTLATFESEDDAIAFAENPAPVTFPPTWVFEVAYGDREELEDGVVLQSIRAEDSVVATGYRAIWQEDETVVAMQWLASGNASSSMDGMLALIAFQQDCFRAMPEPCAYLPQDEFPAAANAKDASSGDFPDENALPSLDENNVLAGVNHDWEVEVPADGWEVVNAEFLQGMEFYQLQSGQSLLTIESVRDRATGPDDCILNEAGLLEDFEESAVIELGSDDPSERRAGLEQNHAWAVYTVEPLQEERADQEYTIRIDCYVLLPGEVSLVVTHTAPRDLWTTEREKGERFRNALELPDLTQVASATTPIAGDNRIYWRTIAMGIPRIWIPLAA